MFDILTKFDLADVHFKSDPDSGLQAIIAIHGSTLGPALGGCRFLEYPCEQDALIDAAHLARGMAYKAALANLPVGGGKAVIIKPRCAFDRTRLFSSFADFVETLKGRYITALDSGSTLDDMDLIASRTAYVSSSSKLGDCSESTALGIYTGIQATLKQCHNQAELDGIHIAIQGLGHVGMGLARLMHEAGATLTVCDLNAARTTEAKRLFGARVVSPDDIYSQNCDVFSPCGLGGVINNLTIDKLRCDLIAGAANNQLSDHCGAETLHRKGILYVPDFALNSGGLIYATMKYNGASEEEIKLRLAQIPATITELLQQSEITAVTPYQAAIAVATKRIKALSSANQAMPSGINIAQTTASPC